jgi:hypothetical protein
MQRNFLRVSAEDHSLQLGDGIRDGYLLALRAAG